MKLVRILTVAAIALFASGSGSASTPVTDCPLRDMPFSARSPLIDILLSPPAKAAVERELHTSFARMPQMFVGTTAPTFAAILDLEKAALFLRQTPEAIAQADAALRALPVTAEDKIARCARYDNDVPRFEAASGRPRILLFEKINGFKDVPGFDAAHRLFVALAAENGWSIVSTDKGGVMNSHSLAHFDLVIWNNVSGDVLTLAQREAFRRYLQGGGGFLGVHGSAGDPIYFWEWYVDQLLGARFEGHPIAKQFQPARVVVEDHEQLAAGLPPEWTMTDEWYSFSTNPRSSGAHIIATLDEQTYSPEGMAGQNLKMGDHPIAWSKCIGNGRMFYSAIGHRPESYSRPEYRTMLTNAVRWLGEKKPCRAQ